MAWIGPAEPPLPRRRTRPRVRSLWTPASLGGGAVAVLAGARDVLIEGGRIFPEHKVVVTRTARGTFKAFTAICTMTGAPSTKWSRAGVLRRPAPVLDPGARCRASRCAGPMGVSDAPASWRG
jgi:hypothetical protein